MRVPERSESVPHRNEPTPMKIQFRSAIVEMPVRLHPIDSSIGLRKIPSENSVPMPMQVMSAAAPSTIQP